MQCSVVSLSASFATDIQYEQTNVPVPAACRQHTITVNHITYSKPIFLSYLPLSVLVYQYFSPSNKKNSIEFWFLPSSLFIILQSEWLVGFFCRIFSVWKQGRRQINGATKHLVSGGDQVTSAGSKSSTYHPQCRDIGLQLLLRTEMRLFGMEREDYNWPRTIAHYTRSNNTILWLN